jgi:aryl-alcohol dehydrogenase-like predicted oxidoreductase
VEGSLRRLQTDYLDLFLLHSPPVDVLRYGDWPETLERLRQQGKIRYYGVSCLAPSDALYCLEVSGLDCVQLEINLLNREKIDSLLPQLAGSKLGIVARQPFGSGALTQTDEKRRKALAFVLEQPGIASVLVGMRDRQHLQDNLALFAQRSNMTADGGR